MVAKTTTTRGWSQEVPEADNWGQDDGNRKADCGGQQRRNAEPNGQPEEQAASEQSQLPTGTGPEWTRFRSHIAIDRLHQTKLPDNHPGGPRARSAAVIMSARQRRHSLSGTHGLTVDPVTELRADHPRSGQVDTATEQTLELVLDAGQAEVADGRVELGDEVQVAIGPGLVARDGTDDQEQTDAEPAKVVTVGSEELDGFSSAHAGIVGRARFGWKHQPPGALHREV
jgi:hypothetical protein